MTESILSAPASYEYPWHKASDADIRTWITHFDDHLRKNRLLSMADRQRLDQSRAKAAAELKRRGKHL